MIVAQLAMLTGCGGTKSLTSRVEAGRGPRLDEDRAEKPSQTPARDHARRRQVDRRLTELTPVGTGFGTPNGLASDAVLIAASATTVRVTGALQAVPVQLADLP